MQRLICGIDEAGRGPLAGPVYAASVILCPNFPVELLNDSKKLSAKKRDELESLIKEKALCYGIGIASHEEIDKLNILQAALLAMSRSFDEMQKNAKEKSSFSLNGISVIVDGNKTPALPCPCKSLVKADAQIPAVMAASILAKTARDKYMLEMSKLYPEYGYEKHKGYGTKRHRDAIKKYGPSPIQRLTFSVS